MIATELPETKIKFYIDFESSAGRKKSKGRLKNKEDKQMMLDIKSEQK